MRTWASGTDQRYPPVLLRTVHKHEYPPYPSRSVCLADDKEGKPWMRRVRRCTILNTLAPRRRRPTRRGASHTSFLRPPQRLWREHGSAGQRPWSMDLPQIHCCRGVCVGPCGPSLRTLSRNALHGRGAIFLDSTVPGAQGRSASLRYLSSHPSPRVRDIRISVYFLQF